MTFISKSVFKKVKASFCIIVALFSIGMQFCYGATRTWTGVVNSDFNNSGNYTGAGALLTTDDIVIALTAAKTITMSASITVNSLTFSLSNGNALATFSTNGFILTTVGNCSFDALILSSPTKYDQVIVQLKGVGSGIIVNGTAQLHNTGSGITYLEANVTNPGSLTLNGNVNFGINCRTQPTIEPHFIFDAPTSQTVTFNNTYYCMGETIDFGSANSPLITFTGSGDVYFYSFDGSVNVNNTTHVILGNCYLDRYYAVGGSFNMAAGSQVDVGGTNSFPGFNFRFNYATYNVNITSTVKYYGTATVQDIASPRTFFNYGYLIISGSGRKEQLIAGGIIVRMNMTVDAGADYYGYYENLTVDGNTLNNGTFESSLGTNTFLGNFINNSSFTYDNTGATALCTFNGTAAQTIGGTSSTHFYKLTINNSSGIAAGVTQTINEQVDHLFTLTNGVYNLNLFTLTINNAVTTAVTGGSSTSYVISELSSINGILAWNVGNTVGSFRYPFGYSGNFIPFTFQTTIGAGAGGSVSLATYHTPTNNTPWAPTVTNMNGSPLNTASCDPGTDGTINLVVDRFWQITVVGAPTANVTFSYPGIENTTAAICGGGAGGTLVPQRWTGSMWSNPFGTGNAGVTSGVGTVYAAGITTFSPWILSTLANVLPVKFTQAAANCDKNGNTFVSWTTASEDNNNYFTPERSPDGVNFSALGDVQGAGTSVVSRTYTFLDTSDLGGQAFYYRIKQTDFNDNFAYSGIVLSDRCLQNAQVKLFGNQSNDGVVIKSPNFTGNFDVALLDLSGRKVFDAPITMQKGTNTVKFPEYVSNGIYLCILSNENQPSISTKILVNR